MTWPAQNLIITGGRGRLACLIADEFGKRGSGIRLFSRQGGVGFSSMETLFEQRSLKSGGVLLHLAWSCLPATAEQQPELPEREDLPFLSRLLTALLAVPSIHRPHLIFFSSGGAVYGNAPGRPSEECDVCQPVGAYGRAKLAAERIIEVWAREHGCSHTILRISNPYGYTLPHARPQGIIPHAIRASILGCPLTLWGDGSARKDFIYYTDFLAALAEVIALRPRGTFNLCNGESHSLNEVLGEVERQTGQPIIRTHTMAAKWDVQDSRLANNRIREVTSWHPKVSLQDGVRLNIQAIRAYSV